ncbi:MAG: hypothetical protein PHW53_05030 [Patescibacteria group bacterium]|nr:hypothetical protein [Patescibacteria group bacterium]
MIKYSTGLITKLFGENGVDTGANGLRGLMKDGCIRVYSGAQPADADSAVTGTLLGSITTAGGAFVEGAATNGLELGAPSGRTVSKASNVWTFTGVAAGTMGWFRFQANAADDDSSSTTLVRIDGSIGITSGDMRVTSVTSAVASTATVDTFVITAA